MVANASALAETTALAAGLQRALPPSLRPLFDGAFLRSWDLYDEFVYRLALGVFQSAGLETLTKEPGTSAEIVARAGFDPYCALVPLEWILHELAARQLLEEATTDAGVRWRRRDEPLPVLDPDPVR